MTNKEKYPNAQILENTFASDACNGRFYIRLLSNGFKKYLKRDGSIGEHDSCNPRNTYHKTEQDAQTALNNFMNETPEITLKEIKLRFEEAKKLIDKKIKKLQGNKCIGEIYKVAEVKLVIEQENFPYSNKALSFLRENGYVIFLTDSGDYNRTVFDNGCFTVINEVSVTAHDGQTYTAESDGDCWKFGCARINKSLIKNALALFEEPLTGNRRVEKITIGKCDFTCETLKTLAELES